MRTVLIAIALLAPLADGSAQTLTGSTWWRSEGSCRADAAVAVTHCELSHSRDPGMGVEFWQQRVECGERATACGRVYLCSCPEWRVPEAASTPPLRFRVESAFHHARGMCVLDLTETRDGCAATSRFANVGEPPTNWQSRASTESCVTLADRCGQLSFCGCSAEELVNPPVSREWQRESCSETLKPYGNGCSSSWAETLKRGNQLTHATGSSWVRCDSPGRCGQQRCEGLPCGLDAGYETRFERLTSFAAADEQREQLVARYDLGECRLKLSAAEAECRIEWRDDSVVGGCRRVVEATETFACLESRTVCGRSFLCACRDGAASVVPVAP